VAFARRPGAYAFVIDCATGAVLHQLTPPDGRQFNGHGVFAQGGKFLFTSEQDSASSAGVIGIWDVNAAYSRVGEMPSHGIGPHDLRLMPDGVTLILANGGIKTDPSDRTKLNIDVMRPNLSYVSFDGTLIEQVELPPDLSKNSIRHLALRDDGLVAFAMQWEGEADAATPLLGLHQRGTQAVLARAPQADELVMQGYAGSVAFTGKGQEVAISSPRGGRLHRFSGDGTFLGALQRDDVCGLATHPDGLLASDGLGGLIAVSGDTARALSHADCAWDNHIVSL
jgi:hypothetical protein